MSDTATPGATTGEAGAPQLPECLVCGGHYLTVNRPDQTVIEGHKAAADTDVPCAGSNVPAVTGDAMIDELRRGAITEATNYEAKAARARADFARALTDEGWTMHATMRFYGADAIRKETIATLWRDLAVAGTWWPVVCTALEHVRVAGDSAADLMTLASVEETRKGAQQWLRGVRFDVLRDHSEGLTAAQAAELFGAL